MHQAFLYISLLSMHGYKVEMPIFSSFVADLITRRLSSSFPAGADPGFFLGGGALVSCSSSTPINHKVFFLAEYQLNQKTAGHLGGGGGAHPQHPPPRSAPVLHLETVFQNSTPEKTANIWQIEGKGKSATKFEAAQLHFLSDVFIAVAILVA